MCNIGWDASFLCAVHRVYTLSASIVNTKLWGFSPLCSVGLWCTVLEDGAATQQPEVSHRATQYISHHHKPTHPTLYLPNISKTSTRFLRYLVLLDSSSPTSLNSQYVHPIPHSWHYQHIEMVPAGFPDKCWMIKRLRSRFVMALKCNFSTFKVTSPDAPVQVHCSPVQHLLYSVVRGLAVCLLPPNWCQKSTVCLLLGNTHLVLYWSQTTHKMKAIFFFNCFTNWPRHPPLSTATDQTFKPLMFLARQAALIADQRTSLCCLQERGVTWFERWKEKRRQMQPLYPFIIWPGSCSPTKLCLLYRFFRNVPAALLSHSSLFLCLAVWVLAASRSTLVPSWPCGLHWGGHRVP